MQKPANDYALTMQKLFQCLRSRYRADATETDLKRYTAEEWSEICIMAKQNNLAPLLYREIKEQVNNLAISRSDLELLHNIYMCTSARNIQLYHQLATLQKALNNANIPVITLKGAHLAALVYRNISLRQMCDVDLLIHKEDIQQATAILLEQGYEAELPLELIANKLEKHMAFRHRTSGLVIELHWMLAQAIFSIKDPLDSIWNRAQPAVINNESALVCAPEHLLIHLSLHFMLCHALEYAALPLFDIAEVLVSQKIDWDLLRKDAAEWQATKILYLMLRLVATYCAVSPPAALMDSLRPPDANDYERQAQSLLLKQKSKLAPTWNLRVWSSGSLREKIVISKRIFFQSPQEIAMRHDLPLSTPAYRLYWFRMIDLWRRYGRSREFLRLRNQSKRNKDFFDWLQTPAEG